MQKHTKIYFDHYHIAYYPGGEHEPINCEVCKKRAVDIHHVNGRLGPDANHIDNLIALCRSCHQDVHSGELSTGDLNIAHRSNLY